MKKNKSKILSLTAIGILLVSCGGQTKPTTTTQSPTTTPEITTTENPTISIPSNADVNNKLQLKMFGGLYYEGIRTIYAIFKDGVSGEVVWSSSNENVVTVSPREGLTTECSLLVRSYGEARITAALKDDPNIVATYDINIEEGQAMPLELFNQIRGGVKMTSLDECLSFDKDYNSKVDESYTITTIYEETDPTNIDMSNLTEAYQINVVNNKTNKTEYEKKYVKGTGSYVSTESLNVDNLVVADKIIPEDAEEGIKWGSSYYQNIWNNEGIITNEAFRTFDGGKTYHYASYYTAPMYLCASMYLLDIAPDAMYFEVEEGKMELHVVVDPYNQDVRATTKYGRHITTTFSDIGTAEIDHIKPFEHLEEHDKLQSAIEKMKALRNYSVTYTMDYEGTADDIEYNFRFTEDTADQVIKQNYKIISHTGAHKEGDSKYYQYEYNDANENILITKVHNKAWEEANIYPTFDLTPEIFEKIDENKYQAKIDTGIFIAYCVYLNAAVSYYDFCYPGVITLNNEGYIEEISVQLDALGEDLFIKAKFSSFGETTCDIKFDQVGDENLPKSFLEDNEYLYKDLQSWGLEEVVPYLYSSAGYRDYVGWVRQKDAEGYTTDEVDYAYFETKAFENDEDAQKFINDYINILILNGFIETDEKLDYNNRKYTFYEKDGYKIAVGKVVNWWNDYEPGSVMIAIRSDLLEAPSF